MRSMTEGLCSCAKRKNSGLRPLIVGTFVSCVGGDALIGPPLAVSTKSVGRAALSPPRIPHQLSFHAVGGGVPDAPLAGQYRKNENGSRSANLASAAVGLI